MIKRTRRAYGYRSPRKRTNASNFEGLAFPKGKTRAQEKAEDHAREVAQIAYIRRLLFNRTKVCACCGQPERGIPHEMNEDPARSKTRKKPPEERFNLRICMRICRDCHVEYTGNVLRCVALTEDGFAGPYCVEARKSKWDRNWVIRRVVG